MRLILGLVALIALSGGQVSARPAPDASVAVRTAFERYDNGWRTYDVDKVVGAFDEDFEWTNEVGLRFTDKAKFKVFLGRLFASPDVRTGTSGPLQIHSIRLIGADVAVVSSSEETDGQTDSATGKVVPALHTNELTVMRRHGGRWLIVSDLASDESHGI
jgi:ketosteroid isomerase-like protein